MATIANKVTRARITTTPDTMIQTDAATLTTIIMATIAAPRNTIECSGHWLTARLFRGASD
jgi:hypothetical protein